PRALERLRLRRAGGDRDDLGLAAVDAVEQRLEVRAAARDEDGDRESRAHAGRLRDGRQGALRPARFRRRNARVPSPARRPPITGQMISIGVMPNFYRLWEPRRGANG